MTQWRDTNAIVAAVSAGARKITFSGESPNEEWLGDIEIMRGADGNVSLYITRSNKKKWTGKKWSGTSVYVTLSGEAWEHLKSVPQATLAEAK
jgi:hypothetical protein